ncbi:hypothetical protein RhiirA4_421894 [Rhizophagus irregularis]|uniref:Uncharacterized protein n=1 Tax=Rhizophagus irregularis TaxID=588596 RepID=A0A2I1GN55_9GLOM|nr:hypothetical protein RhiirA4_421894 [Rhizophagus irregularis]
MVYYREGIFPSNTNKFSTPRDLKYSSQASPLNVTGHVVEFSVNQGKSDYNLNLEEIRAKYMNYDGILCENCNQEIEEYYYYCRYCYYKETDVIKKGHRCKQYLENFSKWISENKFIYNYLIKEQKGEVSDYDLDEDDRLVKYKDFDYILCEKCEPINCTNQQEFISSRYTKRIRTGQVNTIYSDECLDCIIMDKD